ncbi:hypothetical protein B0H14DRAFT_2765450, partial [Mycena olivaceomarginata]
MAHCPALWSVDTVPAHPLFPHCSAGGSIMNACGRDGTSDVGVQCEQVSPQSAGKCGGAERCKGATALPIRICRGTMFPWQGKEVRCQRENGSDNTTLHSRDEWRSMQGTRVGVGTGQRYSGPACLCPFPLPLPVHGCQVQAGVRACPPAWTLTLPSHTRWYTV